MSGGFSIALTSAIAFLFRNWISERLKNSIRLEYEKQLETHKADLKRDYDFQVERLKAELAQQNFRFSHVFENTAAAIETIYQKLVVLKQASDSYVAICAQYPKDSSYMLFHSKAMDFMEYFSKNKIYFPKPTATQIDIYFHILKEVTGNYQVFPDPSKIKKDTVGINFVNEIATKGNQLPTLLQLLEDDFQKILGFPMPENIGIDKK